MNRGSSGIAASVYLALAPGAALAGPCDGGLVFLGKTSDNSRTVWLSGTGAGSFELDAGGNTTVDTWNKTRRGLHISLSPVVSNGNGNPHTLVGTTNGSNCTIDKQNQSGGITFPPNIQLPPRLPPIIGGRPPVGVMPTLPPGGVAPPPVGVMPTLPPGGVAPPLVGVMPAVPGGVTPPIGTLPGGVTPPIAVLPPGQQAANASVDLEFSTNAPLTPGRRFAQSPEWNVWVDSNIVDTTDHRYGLDVSSRSGHLTIGADQRVRDEMVAGLNVIFERNRSNGFGGEMQAKSDGVSIGPYIAYRLAPEWTVDGSFSIGWLDNDNNIAGLTGSSSTTRYSLSFDATGDYPFGNARIYPKALVSYSHFRNGAYDLSGLVGTTPVALTVTENSFNYGLLELSSQASWTFRTSGGKLLVPYAELGVRYEFERPNDGQILTGDLKFATPSPWSGLARLGGRVLISRSMFVEASVGYLSFLQQGLDSWEGRLFLSFAF